MAENNILWKDLAEKCRFKTFAFEAEFFLKKNIKNYVMMLSEIWETNKGVNLFEIFSDILKENFNENFDFV